MNTQDIKNEIEAIGRLECYRTECKYDDSYELILLAEERGYINTAERQHLVAWLKGEE